MTSAGRGRDCNVASPAITCGSIRLETEGQRLAEASPYMNYGEPRAGGIGQGLYRGKGTTRRPGCSTSTPATCDPVSRPLPLLPRRLGSHAPRRRHQPLRLRRRQSGRSCAIPSAMPGWAIPSARTNFNGGWNGGGAGAARAASPTTATCPGRVRRQDAGRAGLRPQPHRPWASVISCGRVTDGVESVFQRVASSLFAGTVPARVLDPLTGIYYYTIEPTAPPVIVPPASKLRRCSPVCSLPSQWRRLGHRCRGPEFNPISWAVATGAVPIGPGRPTKSQQTIINEIGKASGCHTCGTMDPGTKSRNFVVDHQPPNALNGNKTPQQGYPQCLNCSQRQGGEVNAVNRGWRDW